MSSGQIFEYSNDFLNEIIDDLIKLKIKKTANPKNKDFENKIRLIFGKNLNESSFESLLSLKENEFKKKLMSDFKEKRDERIKFLGENQSKEIEKRIFLQSIDINWKSHIQYLEQLRQVIGLRSYGQRDPLIEYKKEAFELFENLLKKLKLDFITILLNLKIVEKNQEESIKKKETKILNNPKCLLIIKKDQKISRNERCDATGKKFKNCCGAL